MQRVCIARTLLLNPDIIILMNPSVVWILGISNFTISYKLHAKVSEYFIFITYDEQLLWPFNDRILILENGQFINEIQDLAGYLIF